MLAGLETNFSVASDRFDLTAKTNFSLPGSSG